MSVLAFPPRCDILPHLGRNAQTQMPMVGPSTHAPRPMRYPYVCSQRARRLCLPMSWRSVPKICFLPLLRYDDAVVSAKTTGHGFGWAMRAWWFLLLVALAGPQREKPHLPTRINAGTVEPLRVSPPEAVAYR